MGCSSHQGSSSEGRAECGSKEKGREVGGFFVIKATFIGFCCNKGKFYQPMDYKVQTDFPPSSLLVAQGIRLL